MLTAAFGRCVQSVAYLIKDCRSIERAIGYDGETPLEHISRHAMVHTY